MSCRGLTVRAVGDERPGSIKGASATIEEGVPGAEVGRGPALLEGVSCVWRQGRGERGGRNGDGGEGSTETTLNVDGTALAGSDIEGAGRRGVGGGATTDSLVREVLHQTQREGSLAVGIGGKTGRALGLGDVTVGTVGRWATAKPEVEGTQPGVGETQP